MAKITQPIKYPGGKHYLASKIIALFPKRYLTYCEPYFGGGSVLLGLNPNGHSEVINDLDGELMNFWNIMRDNFSMFKDMVERIPFSEDAFKEANSHKFPLGYKANVMGCRWALQFFIRCRQSLAGRKQSFTPVSTSRVRRGMNEQVSSWLTAIEGLPVVHERLKRVLILNRSAVDVIRQIDHKQTVFYCDPPYLHETRVTTKEYGQFEMKPADHVELLESLAGISGKFVLSGYRSDMYDKMAKSEKWRRVDFKIPNSAAGGKKKRIMTESCWMNY